MNVYLASNQFDSFALNSGKRLRLLQATLRIHQAFLIRSYESSSALRNRSYLVGLEIESNYEAPPRIRDIVMKP